VASCLGWAFLSAAYRLSLPVNEVVKTTLFFALLGTLVHSAGCVMNDMLDRDLDRKVGRFQSNPDCDFLACSMRHRTFTGPTDRIRSCH
jgi:4-hydroxybenzoate polyprenyltransferase